MIAATDVIAFAVAFLGSLFITVPVRKLALHYGMVDLPGPRKVHAKPIPLMGGIAIYLGFILAILVGHRGVPEQQIVAILSGATLVTLVGFLDDCGLLHHQIKLFVAMPLASLILVASGIRAQLFSQFMPGTAGALLDAGFTVFWVVGITAAFSILDHMDGLCAGIAAVAAAFFTVAAILGGQTMVPVLGAAVLGATLGFLRWNFNPAKIFMGDGGAMFLGFLMATLGLKIRHEGTPSPIGWLVPILILGVPIFDTTLVSISRARRGLLPFTSPGKDHTAHRLSNLGLGHRGAVLVLYCLATLYGALALLVPRLKTASDCALAAVLVMGGLVAVFFLENAPYERQSKPERSPGVLAHK
ncbi:MAG TPA: MraY family glycosyltransferase [Candidatus Acidoferrales bacterium]|nr:MraY family glycosyltransferase [Candidatus Acidoferrales bacterium]